MGFFLIETDHFSVPAPPVGLRRRTDINRFQNIGLPLGIIPIENIGTPVKIHLKPVVISIIE